MTNGRNEIQINDNIISVKNLETVLDSPTNLPLEFCKIMKRSIRNILI